MDSADRGDESHLPTPEGKEPPRKKVRKGTRSCWECKHRKVRCHFAIEGDSSCKECVSRGSACRSQDLPEPDNIREMDRSNLNDRMGRVELLLEKVLDRMDGFDGATSSEKFTTIRSPEVVTPANDNAPVLSLFQNEVLDFQQSHATVLHIASPAIGDWDMTRLRRDLLALMLPQVTLNRIAEASSCWWLLRAQCFQNHGQSLLPIPFSELSTSHPIVIAKCLLWVALSLQQLPIEFAIDSLQLPRSRRLLIEQYMAAMSALANFDEAMLNSLDGIECLILRGILYNNDGKLRSSWLSYRRALNVAQMVGLHSPIPATKEPSEVVSRAKAIWKHTINADRYLSLMLGMHHGIGDAALEKHNQECDEVPNSVSMDALCRIAGFVIERNQRFYEITPAMVRMTQTIDADIGAIGIDWIDVETISFPSRGKTTERAESYTKLMTHLWFHQLTAWLHLPFLLKSNTPGRYDYSRQRCLQASREMITCYTKIRYLTAESFCCKSLDFQAFTAAVALVLNMLSPNDTQHHDLDDWTAVENVMDVLRQQEKGEYPDKVATRGLAALETLKGIMAQNRPTHSVQGETRSLQKEQKGHVKIDIPYFGTFSLNRNIRRRTERHQDQTRGETFTCPSTAATGQSLSAPAENPTVMFGTGEETSMGLGNEDLWTFDVGLTALPPFLSDFGDDWDLGL